MKKLFTFLAALLLTGTAVFALGGGGGFSGDDWHKTGNKLIAGSGVTQLCKNGGTVCDTIGTATASANKALSNLTGVAINTSLLSDTALTDNLGSEAFPWLKGFFGNELSFEGVTDNDYQTTFFITEPTTPDKTITFQDADGIVAMDTNAVTDLEGTKLSITTGTLNVTETDSVVGAITGIVKADGAGNISAATADTDYLVNIVADATPQLGGNLDAQSTYKISNLIDPTATQDAATKNYVDNAAEIDIDYFFGDTASDIGGIYYAMTDSQLGGGESTLTTAGLTAATDDQALVNFATLTGEPGIIEIPSGIFSTHFHAEKTAGTSDVNLYAEVYKRASGGAEVLLLTTETSGLVTSKDSFGLHGNLATDTTILATDRIVIKYLANVGGGSGATVAIYQEGTTSSHLAFPTTTNILSNIFVRQDGAKALSANWDAGAFTITGTQFISDIAIGTAPFVVTSTTPVSNLSIGGNAATVTNATLTTALTVDTGTLTLTAAAANSSVLTIGAGAVGVSGSNTGDSSGHSGLAAALSGTINEIAYFDSGTTIASLAAATYPSLAELAYVKGVTSAIQTQFTGKADTTLGNIASVAIPVTIASDTYNTDALGTSAIGWSDLFLGNGAVIDWTTAASTSDVTLTHSANLLTFAGGTIALGTATATGGITGALTGNADTVTGFTPASGSLTLAGADAVTITTTGATNSTLPLGTKTLVATDVATLSSLTSVGALATGSLAAGFTDVPIAQGGTGASTLAGASIPTYTSTNTFTNKRITKRVVTTTTDATAVIDIDVTDVYELTAMDAATTFTLTGTPTDGQNLIVRAKDDGTTRALTWTGFTAIGITLPTDSTAGKWHYVGCTYNLGGTAWHCIATAEQE